MQEEIAECYGASTAGLKPIRAGQGGATVMEAILDEERRALRISGPFLSARPAWIEFEGELLNQAHLGGVSVAAALRGKDGMFGQSVEGGVALLTQWAEGNMEWPTPRQKAMALGREVARLHKATVGTRPPEGMRSFDNWGLLDRPMQLLGEIADVSPLHAAVEEMRARIDAIPKNSETFGPIHGDVHQGNCHFEGEQPTLIDFAQCGVGWRTFDLAGFLWPWRDATIEKPDIRIACDAYLDGYRQERPLLPEEESALPAFIRARDLWEAGEWVAVGNAREKPAEIEAGILAWSKQWTENPLSSSLA